MFVSSNVKIPLATLGAVNSTINLSISSKDPARNFVRDYTKSTERQIEIGHLNTSSFPIHEWDISFHVVTCC